MQKKKICMVGDFAVGKTSLTQKFVNNVFSDKYLTTVGVKIDTANVGNTKIVVWDVAGRDTLSPVNASYLVGASGLVLVGDGTRPESIKSIKAIWETAQSRIGDVPKVVALNKVDSPDWEVSPEQLESYLDPEWEVFKTSAKEDRYVSRLFERLVEMMAE